MTLHAAVNAPSLRDAVCQSLEAILHAPTKDNERLLVDYQREEGSNEPSDYALTLLGLALDQRGALALRQMAALVLKALVDRNWSTQASDDDDDDEEVMPPLNSSDVWELPASTKERLRAALLEHGLRDSEAKIRSALACIVAKVAHHDWPEQWPQLFDALMMMLRGDDLHQTQGAMQVLTGMEFIRDDITDQQFPQVAPVLLPELIRIFATAEYSGDMRCLATSIFRECIGLLYMVKEEYPHAAPQHLAPVVPAWVNAFKETFAFAVRDQSAASFIMRFEIVLTINQLAEQFPKMIASDLGHFLEPVWVTLNQLLPKYLAASVNEGEDDVAEGESLERGIYALFDFLGQITRRKSLRAAFITSQPGGGPTFMWQLMQVVLNYMQMTTEQEDAWLSDPNQLIADEDEETFSYNPRVAGDDLIASLLDKFPKEGLQSLLDASMAIIPHAKPNADNSAWWKPAEACLFALGRCADALLEGMEKKSVQFDLSGFFDHVIQSYLTCTDAPFIRGRALWLASQFSSALPMPLALRYCEVAVGALKNHQEAIPVRISAIKAIQKFCQALDAPSVAPFQVHILHGICDLLPVATEDALMLLLETLSFTISIDDKAAAAHHQLFMPLLLKVWTSKPTDHIVNSCVTEIFDELAGVGEMYLPLIAHSGPVFVAALQGYRADCEDACAASSNAIDLLAVLIKKAPAAPPAEVIQLLAPTLALLSEPTLDDANVLQSGQLFVKALIERFLNALPTLAVVVGGQSVDGLHAVLGIFARLLNPVRTAEASAVFTGDLLLKYLIHGAGNAAVEATIPNILGGVIMRLARAEMTTTIQSMVVVVAWLVERQLATVLDFLENAHTEGGNGIEVLMRKWCEHFPDFHGYYAVRLCTSALCKLVQSGDARVAAVMVKGDRIVDQASSGRIVTRSQTKSAPERWTETSALVKAVKLLLNQWSMEEDVEGAKMGRSTEDVLDMSFDDDDDEDGEDWEEEGASKTDNVLDMLDEWADEEEKEDEDYQKDTAIYRIVIKPFISDFFKALSRSNHGQLQQLALAHLTADEQALMQGALH